MSRTSDLAARRPWRVVAAFVALFAVSLVLGGRLTGALSVAGFEDPGSEAIRSGDRLEQATGAAPGVSLVALIDMPDGATPADPAGRRRVMGVADRIAKDPAVAPGGVLTPYARGGEGLISTDGSAAYVAVGFRALNDDAAADAAERIADRVEGLPYVRLGGAAVANDQISTTIGEDLARAEMLAFPLIFLLSLWVFRGVVAALLPPLMGGDRDLRLAPRPRPVQRGDDPLDLRPQPRHRPEPGPRDRLQPADRLALPGGDGPHGPGREALRRTLATAGQQRALQRGHRRRGAGRPDGLPAALPVLDGHRRRHGRAVAAAGRAGRAARRAGAARPAHQLARAEGLAPPRERGRPPGHVRLLVPPVAARHAPAGADRASRPRRC